MDKELKAKWVAALRSGDFEQGRGSMRPQGAYCCLAVLGEVSGESPFDQNFNFGTLVAMNDGKNGERPHSFAEIADYIEKNL